ncbi:hypothetical protein [uncultured Flavobacterium sp.]|uniref:hypothetical protein n=1 Tax=uncultured Flavobacterium sp. TaxID=165435 RepID=UPI00120AEB88|nr:hypothetical protein [uncultured Flavobacterium sp.]THD34101.1 MAG: hypothetical protein DI588_02865 [Flavobacterium johnsoniae]
MKSILIMGIFASILSLLGLGKKESNSQNYIQTPTQIKISQLAEVLQLLQDGKTEYDLFGITSNGIDCIYFVREGKNFQVEFEAMTKDQIPFIEKLKTFATQNGFGIEMISYGNKPHYGANPAPVIRIITHSNLKRTTEIGQKIQKEVFNNNAETVYDVVP